jgi:hypothetical protein
MWYSSAERLQQYRYTTCFTHLSEWLLHQHTALSLACKVQFIDTRHMRAEPSNPKIGCGQNPKSDFKYWTPTYYYFLNNPMTMH